MKLDESHLKTLLFNYQLGKNPQNKNKIIHLITPYVFNFIDWVYGIKDHDTKSDFYLYIIERFEPLLLGYKREGSLFSTYLSVSLKNYWKKFNRDLKNKYEIEFEDVDVNEYPDEKVSNEEINFTNDIFNEELHNKFNYLILKLVFFDFFNEDDFVHLKELSNKSIPDCLFFLDKLSEEIMEKKKRQNLYESRISRLHQLIIMGQKQIYLNNDSKDEIKDSEIKINKKQDELLSLYHSVKVCPNYQTIGDFMEIDRVRVSNIINNYKKKIKLKVRHG